MAYISTWEPEELEKCIHQYVRKKERVLLCFPREGSLIGPTLEKMVLDCGGIPVFWDGDLHWKSLLRRGFQERCGSIIGGPGHVLSLSKLAKRLGTPLYIRNAFLVGESPDEWLVSTIEKGLDCCVRCSFCHLEDQVLDEDMLKLRRELRRWTTVLDFRLEKQGGGLSLEMITFHGEKLPKLPSFARLVIREWNPDSDVPIDIPLCWKNGLFSKRNH